MKSSISKSFSYDAILGIISQTTLRSLEKSKKMICQYHVTIIFANLLFLFTNHFIDCYGVIPDFSALSSFWSFYNPLPEIFSWWVPEPYKVKQNIFETMELNKWASNYFFLHFYLRKSKKISDFRLDGGGFPHFRFRVFERFFGQNRPPMGTWIHNNAMIHQR